MTIPSRVWFITFIIAVRETVNNIKARELRCFRPFRIVKPSLKLRDTKTLPLLYHEELAPFSRTLEGIQNFLKSYRESGRRFIRVKLFYFTIYSGLLGLGQVVLFLKRAGWSPRLDLGTNIHPFRTIKKAFTSQPSECEPPASNIQPFKSIT